MEFIYSYHVFVLKVQVISVGGGGGAWGSHSRNCENTVQVRNCGIAWMEGPTNKCLFLHFLWVALLALAK